MFALLALVATISLTQADNGRTFTVPAQSAVVVTLVSNATTGYRWELVKPPNRSVIRVVSRSYVQPKAGKPGAPGEERWRFRAVGAGRVHLRFIYVRPWQRSVVARRFGVTIHVR